MQQIEDLSAIIRKRDNQIEDLNNEIAYKVDENRALHQEIMNIKEEQAKENAKRGEDMMAKLNARKDGGMSATKSRVGFDPQTPAKTKN
jgi:regulator of replication initiation timing